MKPEHVLEIGRPYKLVEMFETSVDKFAGRELFGTKDRATGTYRWATYREGRDATLPTGRTLASARARRRAERSSVGAQPVRRS
ncbi:MAG: hypothetical protein JRI23_06605 [Deltaproteobacteria bacterium]|jgi:hypothetical protein|nr:hypothetical protein [Deltaproteobacteria bacterium]MBW2531258.1 hypothetical protein [Deltaproteobacteria bacterium]